MSEKKLILASTSPRRKELLISAGYKIEIVSNPNIDETVTKKVGAIAKAIYLAKRKAFATKALISEEKLKNSNGIIAADTLIFYKNHIIGKPKTKEEAKTILTLLSGKRHKVVTGCCYICPSGRCFTKHCVSLVYFRKLSEADIDKALSFNEWQDAAGAYKIQEHGVALIRKIKGSLTNIIGLPIEEVVAILSKKCNK